VRALTRDQLRRFPKAELHVHMDGCPRPATMLELAREQHVLLPAADAAALADAVFVRHAPDLDSYLERYKITVSVMQTARALERIAYEFLEDAAHDGVRYVEVRYCPALHTSRMSIAGAIEATLRGLERGQAEFPIMARVIVCALRTLSPSVSDDLARAAVDYASAGVVAFDLAGSEHGHPARDHARAFAHARAHGLACTCHAGEAEGAESIRQALHECGAHRVGHGTRLHEDPALEAEVIARGIPLEVCLTSNVHTHTIADMRTHPARRYLERGGVVTLNTDSRLMDRTTLTDEYWHAHRRLGFDRTQLEQVLLNGFRSAFLPPEEKARMIASIEAELEELA
jgi:adenosine deaminase